MHEIIHSPTLFGVGTKEKYHDTQNDRSLLFIKLGSIEVQLTVHFLILHFKNTQFHIMAVSLNSFPTNSFP